LRALPGRRSLPIKERAFDHRRRTERHRYAQLDGIRIHYVREGSGPPLLLMH
jgi:hypothetical protein